MDGSPTSPPTRPALTPDGSLVALLHTAHEVETRLETALAGEGLSIAKFGMLDQLAVAEQPMTLTELAGRLSCVRSNITQLVDRLEADGFVKRVDDPNDRRTTRAVLTPLGRRRHAAGASAYQAVQAEIMAQMPTSALAAVTEALSSLK